MTQFSDHTFPVAHSGSTSQAQYLSAPKMVVRISHTGLVSSCRVHRATEHLRQAASECFQDTPFDTFTATIPPLGTLESHAVGRRKRWVGGSESRLPDFFYFSSFSYIKARNLSAFKLFYSSLEVIVILILSYICTLLKSGIRHT
jgi:hypothetical protein